MPKKRANGQGGVHHRKDGRWEATLYMDDAGGIRFRKSAYAKTKAGALKRLAELRAESKRAVAPVLPPAGSRRLSDYLDYWLEDYVRINKRPTTYESYKIIVRLFLKPSLGKRYLNELTVPMVQSFLNEQLIAGNSVRRVQQMRMTLSGALTKAMREELLDRNVARLVELPRWERSEIVPWTKEEARRFLEAAKDDPLYPAFALLVHYGMRRGEVAGLRWCDVDFGEGEIRIRQQLLRANGVLDIGPVKTNAGERNLPLLPAARTVLEAVRESQSATRETCGPAWGSGYGDLDLVFTTRYGTPIEPRNMNRSFQRLCEDHGIRVIKMHHVRHTTATLLKDLGVPARDTQLILGHASSWTTQQIYQHDNMESKTIHLEKLACALDGNQPSSVPQVQKGSSGSGRYRCHDSVFMEYLLSVVSVGSGQSQTPPLLLMRQGVSDRVTGVNEALEVARRLWIVGAVAVKMEVKILIC